MTMTKDDTRTLTNSNLCSIEYDDIIAACNGEHFPMSLTGTEAEVVCKAVNIGIDSRLQACFIPERGDDYGFDTRKVGDLPICNALECKVSPESLPVLLRRLFDDMEWCDPDKGDCNGSCDGCTASSLAEGILTCLGFNDCGKFIGRDDD